MGLVVFLVLVLLMVIFRWLKCLIVCLMRVCILVFLCMLVWRKVVFWVFWVFSLVVRVWFLGLWWLLMMMVVFLWVKVRVVVWLMLVSVLVMRMMGEEEVVMVRF